MMTHHEPSFTDKKVLAETAKLEAESKHVDDKMRAEINKLLAESKQIGVNTFLAPFLAAAGLMAATAALVKIFF